MPIYFVFALCLFNGIGVQGARVVLALYALELGAQPFAIGILGATFSLFPMLLAVRAGRFADRFGSRWLLIAGAIAGGVGMVFAYLVSGVWVIFVAAAMMGFSTAVYNVLLQNLVGLLSSVEMRARNFSNFSLMASTTNFLGPLIAGFTIDHSGYPLACLSMALVTLVPVVLVAMRGNILPGGTRHDEHTVRGDLRGTLAEPGVRKALATGSLQNTGDALYQFYMPVYTHAVGLSPVAIGIVLSMNAAAAFVVRMFLPRLIVKFKEDRLLMYAFYLSAASLTLVPFFQGAIVLALISFCFGLGIGCCGPIVTMLMFGSSPAGRSGETLGLKITVNHFTKVVSPVLFGSIAAAFGLPPVFWVNAVMLGAGGVLSRPQIGKRVRHAARSK